MFTCHVHPVGPSQSLILFSDGILDQAGGGKGFGFGRRRLQDILRTSAGLPMPSLGERVADALAQYQGAYPQRDDITVVGFRLTPYPVRPPATG